MMTITKPGLLTSIQDLGRFGFQRYGINTSGAVDPLSHRLANLLVGNDEGMPTLEITMVGPSIIFHKPVLIAICGANLSPAINDRPVPLWRPVLVKEGSELSFGPCRQGIRAYLAVGGGFQVSKVMNSHSTSLRAKIGGFNGRNLESGDEVLFNKPGALSRRISSSLLPKLKADFVAVHWSAGSPFMSKINEKLHIRATNGRQFDLFTKESRDSFFHSPYLVTTQSDRMGCRLRGEALSLKHDFEMISEAVNDGTIQVSADGNPIILLAERQTTGGYPKIAQIASVDIPLVAQAKPGDQIYFSHISHERAQMLFIDREIMMKQIKYGIKLKYLQSFTLQEEKECIRWI